MIKHIVLFMLKDKSEESCRAAAEVLESMRGRVPQVEEMRVGVDFLHSERSCDVILEVVVKDKAALDAYQNDPYHCGTVKPYMHKVRSGSVSADYEF
ncbi:MAG: Dabb family protein [Oscillospiraceae bacterium]|nr:Dabb family protein [Oscillospiraceae bacterium]